MRKSMMSLEKTGSFIELLQKHIAWYPLMEPRDIYKLLYQGIMGPEHLISSPDEFSQYLTAEFDQLLPDPSGRITEPVRPDQSLLRLNLMPYKVHYQQLDQLLSCLLETAQTTYGDINELRDGWLEFVQACEDGLFPNFSLDDVHAFNSWIENLGFPAAHHSESYRREYQPAYRLISNRFIHRLGLNHAG
jgi:hypothetical protein